MGECWSDLDDEIAKRRQDFSGGNSPAPPIDVICQALAIQIGRRRYFLFLSRFLSHFLYRKSSSELLF